MDPKLIVIIGFTYLYGFFEVFMSFRQKGKAGIAAVSDRGSLWLLYGLITLGYTLSFAVGATRLGRLPYWDAFFTAGAIVVLIGLAIRIGSILTLRQYFTYAVARVEGHKIVDTGLYKHIRHPGYLGQLLIFIGVAASLSNWLSILLMMVPVSIGYAYRIRVEERFMREQLGEAYLDYQKRTRRLIPLIY